MSQSKTLVAAIISVCVASSILFADGRRKPNKERTANTKSDAERIAELEKQVQELEARLKKLEQGNKGPVDAKLKIQPVVPKPTPSTKVPPKYFYWYGQPSSKNVPPNLTLPKSQTDGAIIVQPPGVPNGFPPGTKPGTINGMTYYIMPIEKK